MYSYDVKHEVYVCRLLKDGLNQNERFGSVVLLVFPT